MKAPNQVYRKNFSLIIAFLVLVSVVLIIALVVAYNLTTKNVESEFSLKKNAVLEQTTSGYKDFFNTRIPEITSYQGLLNNTSAGNYANSIFHN